MCTADEPSYLTCFNNAGSVQQLASAWEPLVSLQFPDGLEPLYCHSCFLSYSSSVLRHVLEDTQQQQMATAGPDCQPSICTIPLVDDSNVDTWRLALGLIYRLADATITLENAQGLLLLAHKYNMHRVTADVNCFLLSSTGATPGSRLRGHLSTTTVGEWLTTASRCGLDNLVQICIDYSVGQNLPLNMDLLAGLQPSHANQLLAAKEAQTSSHKSRLDKVVTQLGSSSLTAYSCSACGRSWLSRFGDMCVQQPPPSELARALQQPTLFQQAALLHQQQQAVLQQIQQSYFKCCCCQNTSQHAVPTVIKAPFHL